MARWRRALTSLPVLIAGGILALYLLAGYFLVDPLARWALPRYVQDKLNSRASVAEVKFDPLRLALTVKDLRLSRRDGAPLAGLRSLYAELEWSSLLRFAWHLRALDVDGLTARFVVEKDGRLNWSSLLAALGHNKAAPSQTMPRVLIDRLRLSRGAVEYVDKRRSKPFAASLDPINLKLNDLSTLPRDSGGYVLTANLPEPGGKLKWSGSLGLNPLFSQGRAALENLDLARASRVVKLPFGLTVTGGRLSIAANYRLQTSAGKLALQVSGLDAALAKLGVTLASGLGLDLEHAAMKNGAYDSRSGAAGWQSLDFADLDLSREGAPLLRLDRGSAAGLSVDMNGRGVNLGSFKLAGGQGNARLDARGRLDWASALAAAAPGKPAAANAAASAPMPPWRVTLKSVNIAGIGLKFADARFAHTLALEAQDFHLAAGVAGKAGGPQSDWRVTNLAAGTGAVRLLSGDSPVATLAAVNLTGGQFSLAQRQFQADRVSVSAPATRLVREKNGAFNWQAVLAERPARAAETPRPAQANKNDHTPFRFALGQLAIQGARVTFEDLTPRKPVRLELEEGDLSLAHLSQDWNRPVPASLALHIAGSGRLTAHGELIPGQAKGALQLRLAALPLAPFAPYVNDFARLTLKSGSVSTDGRLSFAARSKPLADYRGGFAVDRLAVAEEASGAPFLGWQSLRGRGLDLAVGPGRFNLHELVAIKPFGKIIINPDKGLNLKNVLRAKPAQKATAVASPAVAKSRGGASAAGGGFPIAVRQILIRQGDLQFADLSLKPQFGARIEDLSGAISGLSSRPEASARVELDGRVGQYGSARVRGRLQPFAATDNTDLTLQFRNLEMNPLSPYSGKFAGRLIDSGRLSVDLQYKIKHRQLAGENRFVISKLKLGPAVDSPDAVKLPLDLAIALLENSQGIIDVDIPISGNLDDPKFSYGHLVWQAILNLLTKAVTAPFRALGALLGVDSDKLGTVGFPYGEAELSPPQLDKLRQVGDALAKRPNLQLVVAPTYDAARDTAALQDIGLRRQVARGLRLSVPQGVRPPPIDANDRVTRLVLEDLYDQAFPGGISALRAEIKPKNIVDLYSEAARQLEKRIAIPPSQLEDLAQARARAIVSQLVKADGVPAGRVVVGPNYEKVDRQALDLALKLDLKPAPAVVLPAASRTVPESAGTTSGAQSRSP